MSVSSRMPELPEDLRNYIPGVGYRAPAVPAEPAWKNEPRFSREFNYGGKPVKLFTIGALAQALGKKPVTIRKWIRLGIIPEAGLKTQPITKTLGDAGRRLFTAEQIESVVRIAREEGVWGEGHRTIKFSESPFSGRVWNLWRMKDW